MYSETLNRHPPLASTIEETLKIPPITNYTHKIKIILEHLIEFQHAVLLTI